MKETLRETQTDRGRTTNIKIGSHSCGQQENIFNWTSNSAMLQADAPLEEQHAVPSVTKAEAQEQERAAGERLQADPKGAQTCTGVQVAIALDSNQGNGLSGGCGASYWLTEPRKK